MSSHGSPYYPAKSASNPRPSTSYCAAPSNSAQSAHSSSSRRYGSKPSVQIHNGGGPKYDPANSSSAPNSGYYN